MSKGIILFSGVHGVGKGYFLKNVLGESEEFVVLEASKLISKYKEAADSGYKKVANVSQNQDILLDALVCERRNTEKRIILDGHICVLNSNGEVERISREFFIKSSIKSIILLQDDIERILQRQEKRDGKSIPGEILDKMQKEEEQYCQSLLVENNISYQIIRNSCTCQQFCNIIESM